MPPKSLAELLDILDGLEVDSPRFSDIVAEIVNHGDELPGGLASLCASLVWKRRCAAAAAIRDRRRPDDARLLVALLADAHARVRLQAARAVRETWPGIEPALLRLVDDDNDEVVAAALLALGRIAATAGFDAAVRALGAAAVVVRTAAATCLGHLAETRAVAALLQLVGDEPGPKQAALKALERLLGALTPAEIDAALAGVPELVFRTALAKLDAKTAPPPLKEGLERRAAATADLRELEEYGRLLQDEDAPEWEREALLDALAARFAQPGNKSVVLVGDPGVGKTHVVRALASRLAAATTPWLFLETSTSEVMIGTKYIGEWETRLGGLIAKTRLPRRVVLYFTNVSDLSGAGTTSSNKANFMSLLGPYLRRGEVTIVGEASAQAVQRGLDRAGQKGFFQLINVPEPDAAAVVRILDKQIAELGRRAGVEILVSKEVRDLMVSMAATYFSGLTEPGRSLKLLREVVVPRLEAAPRDVPLELASDDVIAGLARISGLPESLLSDRRPLDPADARAFFEERVLGQREAVDAMVDLITLIKAGLSDPGKPLGVLFFVGPTGVGKTEIAKALAEFIYGSPERMIRLDLSEFKDYDSYEKLIGTRAGRDDGGTLASRVRERPFSVILLDEIEKAHPNIFDLFLQVFDDGRLTDAHGERADFRQSIIVMTSNLGSAAEGGGLGFGAADGAGVPGEERVLKAVRRFFRPEFVNRIGKLVVFKPLGGETMRKIVRRELGKVLLRSGILRRGLRVDVDAAAIDLLLEEGFSLEYGARPLKRRVEQLVLMPIARAIVSLGPEDRGALLKVAVDDGKVTVRRRGARPAATADTERLHLKRPEDERLLSVKPAELPALVGGLETRVAALAARAAADRLPERKSEIVAATAAPSFWDEPERARRLLAEMVHLEDLVEGLSRARRRVDDLAGFARSAARHANLRARFEAAHAELVDELVALEYKFFGERPEDRRDAFVTIRRIGADREAKDAAELLTRMYASWAERRGFALTWLARRDEDGESLCLLEGQSLYGLLRGEEGLHRFEAGGKGAEHRAAFARVDVAARPEAGAGLAARDVRVERAARRGRVEVVAVHAPSGTTVEAEGEVPDELALELLAAELEARARRRGAADDRVVRRYGIEGRYAVDEDTGIRLGHKDILAGGLDEILRARLYGGATS